MIILSRTSKVAKYALFGQISYLEKRHLPRVNVVFGHLGHVTLEQSPPSRVE